MLASDTAWKVPRRQSTSRATSSPISTGAVRRCDSVGVRYLDIVEVRIEAGRLSSGSGHLSASIEEVRRLIVASNDGASLYRGGSIKSTQGRSILLTENATNKALTRRVDNMLDDMHGFRQTSGLDFELDAFLLDDFAITLNETRFGANLAVGMTLVTAGEPIYILESMVNCCGIVVAEVDELDIDSIVDRINNLDFAGADLGKKNHFLNVYRGSDGKHLAVAHTSFAEVKTGTQDVPGLYPRTGSFFNRIGQRYGGNHGSYTILTGESALEYEQAVAHWDEYSCRRREALVLELFAGGRIVFSKSHVNVPKSGVTVLGGYHSNNADEFLLLTEGPGEPARVYQMSDFDFVDAVDGYLTPHGSGILFDYDELEILNNGRIKCCIDGTWMLVDALSSLPFGYKTLARSAESEVFPVLECKISI